MDIIDHDAYTAAIEAGARTEPDTLAEARWLVANPDEAIFRPVPERRLAWHLLLANRRAMVAALGAA